MKFERHLDGRNRQESTAKGDIAFLPADAPTMLRPGMDDPNQLLSYSYLVFEPGYLAELALSNGIGRPLDFIPTFATPDPFLHEITAALTSAPRIKDPAANLFVDSLFNAAGARILHRYGEVRYPFSGPPRLTDDQLRAAIDYMQDHLRESLGQPILTSRHFAKPGSSREESRGTAAYMLGSKTTQGRIGTRAIAPIPVAFRYAKRNGTFECGRREPLGT
jgi:hypothetical protein